MICFWDLKSTDFHQVETILHWTYSYIGRIWPNNVAEIAEIDEAEVTADNLISAQFL